MPRQKTGIESATGHILTVKEDKFISEYIKTGNALQSVLEAGYKTNTPGQYADRMMKKTYIAEEIKSRLNSMHKESIADAQEIMEYFSSVMRGEITDQFGLEAPLSERTKAAQELAKRQIDMVNRANQNSVPELKITLDWTKPNEEQTPTVKNLLKDQTPIVENLLDSINGELHG